MNKSSIHTQLNKRFKSPTSCTLKLEDYVWYAKLDLTNYYDWTELNWIILYTVLCLVQNRIGPY